jgi:hypothetical protein
MQCCGAGETSGRGLAPRASWAALHLLRLVSAFPTVKEAGSLPHVLVAALPLHNVGRVPVPADQSLGGLFMLHATCKTTTFPHLGDAILRSDSTNPDRISRLGRGQTFHAAAVSYLVPPSPSSPPVVHRGAMAGTFLTPRAEVACLTIGRWLIAFFSCSASSAMARQTGT